MADVKTLHTRIALKYDSYANWTNESVAGQGANLKLLKGEIGICEIPAVNGASNVAPTVLFKVGAYKKDAEGNDTTELQTFKELPWASAKAADVYDWAKAKTVEIVETTAEGDFDTKALVFKNAEGSVVKSIPLNFAKPEEVTAITSAIASDLADLTSTVGEIQESLNTLIGEETGSIADAIAAAEGRAKEDAQSKADAALEDAKKYAKGLDDATNSRVDDVAEDVAENAKNIAANAEDIREEASRATGEEAKIRGEFAAADKLITDAIGTSADTSDKATVYGTIAKAVEDAAKDAKAKVDALSAEGGAIAVNAADISTNASEIARVEGKFDEAVTTLTSADGELSDRLDVIETFFEGAYAEDGKPLTDALDTLEEIQNYIDTHGEAAAQMVKDIQANADAIATINSAVGEAGTLTEAVAQNTSDIASVTGRVDDLETLTSGFTGTEGEAKGAIKTAIDAAQTQADKGVADAATAQAAADAADAKAQKAQGEVDALELVVNGVSEVANKAAQDIAQEINDRGAAIETVNNSIFDLDTAYQAADTEINGRIDTIVNTTIPAAEQAAKDYADGKVEALAEGAVADNAKDIAEIKGDYLKAADLFIIDCGTATTVIH